MRKIFCLAITCIFVLAGCVELDKNDVETFLEERHTYPKTIEVILFRNVCSDAESVISTGLVRDGFMTAQLKHTLSDIGKPLINFTDKASPYLLPTSDTLKSFDEQKLKVAVEYFSRIVNIQVSASGKDATVDYVTMIKDVTPFAVLYRQNINGEQLRRIYLTRNDNAWQWNGRIVKLSAKQ